MRGVAKSCRTRLKPRDFDFIALVMTGTLAEETAIRSLLGDPGTLDVVLDLPELFRAIVESPDALNISPHLYFYVLVRHVLNEAGIEDVEVADYIGATLADHAPGNVRANHRAGEILPDFSYHIDFIESLEDLSDYYRFFLQVSCGNQFLVLTGLFPRFLRHRAERRGAPGVHYYECVARDAFLAAREHPLAEEFAVAVVYQQLADRFAEARQALNRMANEFLC